MENIFIALVPIFSLILIGYFLKQIKFPSYEFWPLADKLTYFILMPSLLIYKLSSASLNSIENLDFIFVTLISISIVFIFLVVANKFLKTAPDDFTSIVQGAIRFNTYVFLALSDSIFGDKGLVFSALLLAFVIPFINIICISVFAIYVNNNLKFIYLLKSIITNPLIVACLIGGFLSYFNINLPIIIKKILETLSSAALPLGLLSVGFGLIITKINSIKIELTLAIVSKLILTPIIIYIVSLFFNIETNVLLILMIFSVLPTAPSSFVFARQLGGNIQTMSSIITLQTIFAIVATIVVLKYFYTL